MEMLKHVADFDFCKIKTAGVKHQARITGAITKENREQPRRLVINRFIDTKSPDSSYAFAVELTLENFAYSRIDRFRPFDYQRLQRIDQRVLALIGVTRIKIPFSNQMEDLMLTRLSLCEIAWLVTPIPGMDVALALLVLFRASTRSNPARVEPFLVLKRDVALIVESRLRYSA